MHYFKIFTLFIVLIFVSADIFADDKIISYSGPSEVMRGDTVTITVEYEVDEPRVIQVGLQRNRHPWTGYIWEQKTVSGSGSVDIAFKAPDHTPLGDSYQIPIILYPIGGGWHSRLDNKRINPVRVKSYSYTCANTQDFEIVYTTNEHGGIKLIGNTNICEKNWSGHCINPGDKPNNHINGRNKDGDTNPETKNSSSALLEIPSGAEILWAGMFWQGNFQWDKLRSWEPSKEYLQNESRYIKLGYTSSRGSQNVSYERIKSDRFNWLYLGGNHWYYQGFADVTDFVKNHKSGWYWGADLKTIVDRFVRGGSLGAWSIAIAYKDANESMKNITIYHGYKSITGVISEIGEARDYAAAKGCDTSASAIGIQTSTTFSLSGFRTPRSGDVKSTLIFFGGEGDIRWGGDALSITDKNGMHHTLSNSVNPSTNIMNSSISSLDGTHVGDSHLYPRYGYNTIGIDIDTFDIGTSGANIIGNNQTQIDARMYSNAEGYYPGAFGIATELYMPRFCYDYNIQKNGVTLDVDESDRNITVIGDGNLKAHVSIRSMEGDFDLENSKLKFYLSPSDKFSFVGAKYSPDPMNILLNAITTPQHTTTMPEIAIGKNATGNGGTIGSFQRFFAQYSFDIPYNELIEANFDIDLNTSIDFGSGPAEYLFSTKNNTLPRCEQNLTYNPLLGAFNIERTDSGSFDPVTEPQKRFPLYTQISNKVFDISVVSYDINASPSYMNELTLPEDIVVDIELIDASPYNDKNSYFTCYNTQSQIIQELANGEKSYLAKLNKNHSRTDIRDIFLTENALRNAAFRIWYFENNNTLIFHDCDDKTDGQCWREDVHHFVKSSFSYDYCASRCSSANDGNDKCYTCLRQYYAKPVCSRDNFAVRPASYFIQIKDNNESNITSAPGLWVGSNYAGTSLGASLPDRRISAEYMYKIFIRATQYNAPYYRSARKYNAKFTTPMGSDMKSVVSFDSSTGSSCSDTNDTEWGLWFEDGQCKATIGNSITNNALQSNTLVSIPNVGDYTYRIIDHNWTIVDQKRYVDKNGNSLKTFPDVDDCISTGPDRFSISSTNTGMNGCSISSDSRSADDSGATIQYRPITIRVFPYSFDISQINPINRPDNNNSILFMNDFSNSYYQTPFSSYVSMATSFEGNVTALGKRGTVLSNFTKGCAAEDVWLDLNRTMIPDEESLKVTAPMQQYLEAGINIVDTKEGNTTRTFLPKDAFEDTNRGHAPIKLHTTIKKPFGEGNAINPVHVNYDTLQAKSPGSRSTSDMKRGYIPKGDRTYNTDTIYAYGKITPRYNLYENIEESFVLTPIYVDIFCDDSTLISGDCASLYGLDKDTLGEDEESVWKIAKVFISNNDLGTTNLKAMHHDEEFADPYISVDGGAKAKTLNDVAFNDNQASQNDLNVSVAGNDRNSMVKVEYDPVPWLIYDEDEDYFRVHFIGPSSWAGVGQTGHVTDTGSSKTKNNRMSW